MRILLIHQMFLEEDDPGGSRFNEMAKVWANEGNDITVLGGMMHYNGHEKRDEYKGKYFVNKKQGQLDVWRCHVSESYNANFLGRLWGYFSFMFAATWVGLFKTKGKYDVILVTSPPLFVGVTAFILSFFKKIPYVFEVRDLWPESAIDTGVLNNKLIIKLAYWVEGFLYKNASLINVLTPAFKTHLINIKKVKEDKILFIPNAADFSLSDTLLENFDASQMRNEMGWQDKFIVTYVGAHGVANGLHQVLDAAELLKDTNILFLLIGNGMTKESLIIDAKNRGIENVVFLNSVPKADVFKYILISDMGASILKNVPAFKTVYSNKTFDYMACKKPILMAIDGVSRELVEEADAGCYVIPEDPQSYNEVLRKYISSPQLLKKQGENGYNFAKKNFDRKVLAQNYLIALNSQISKS
jgi:glycosyltransferase involved in cell wall biosynthesis